MSRGSIMPWMDSPPVIVLPDPCLVVLVGAAGSGKSTFAARHFAPSEVLSSDAFRELVSGDPANQAATRPAFAALHATLALRLGERHLTVVDATNVQANARRQLTRRAAEAGVRAIAVVLDLPIDVVLARNAARQDRVVPEAAVRRQLAELDRSLRAGNLDREGFAPVVRLTGAAAVEAVRVVRAG
jgi:protein phosphatase